MWWIAAGISLLSAYGSYRTSKSQSALAAEGMQIARENAAIKKKENAEAERRAAREQAKVEGEAKAMAYASGARGDSQNFNIVREAISTEHKRQMEWLEWSGDMAVESIIRTGEYNRRIGEAQADASVWNAYTSIAKAGGYAYTGLATPSDPITIGSTGYESTYDSILTSTPAFESNTPFTGFNPFYTPSNEFL